MSFGGVRDPHDRGLDTYSPLEAAAVQYAVSNGVLVVAAVGNADSAPTEPWNYAGYPAALPHVLGVSSLNRDGTVPNFSNRDIRYVDIAAPGEEIFSTLPRALTASSRPGCLPQGYSDCGPMEFRRGEGTSFSAPQVSAAAALLFATDPALQADQVSNILTRTAVDSDRDTGCLRCYTGRDPLTGWGLLDVGSAVQRARRSAAGARPLRGERPGLDCRHRVGPQGPADQGDDRLLGRSRTTSTRSRSTAGRRSSRCCAGPRARTRISSCGSPARPASAALRSPSGSWPHSPGRPDRWTRSGSASRQSGWYYLVVKIASPGSGKYTLRYRKKRPRAALRAARP